MTKILVISPSIFPGKTGDSTNYTEIVNQLARDGFEIFLICPKNPTSKNQTSSISDDVEIIRIPILPPRLKEIQDKARTLDYFRFLIFMLFEFLIVSWVIRRKKIKYAIIRHDILTSQLPFLFKLLRLRSIADGELMGEVLKNKLKGTIFNLIKRYEKRAVKWYSFYKVTSEGQSKHIKQIGFPESKILIIPIGINTKKIPKVSLDQTPKHTFGYFGVLEEWQGLDILLSGFQILHKKIPESKLYILGDGTLKRQLEKKVYENNLSSNVFFDSVSREVLLNEYFNKFRITVIPRPKHNDSKDEIIPIKLIESISGAKPTIVMDLPIMRKFKNCVYISPSSDPKVLAKTMYEFSSDEKKMKEYSENAYTVSKNYDIQKMVMTLVDNLMKETQEK